MSSRFSPYPSYVLGSAFIGLGLLSFIQPLTLSATFGLPTSSPGGPVSPFLYAKAGRDLMVGILCFVFQYQGNDPATTALLAALGVVGVVDGAVVWNFGKDLRWKAWNHWGGTGAIVGYAIWRMLE